MAYTHVLTPITIGSLEIKNRVVRTAHTTVLGAGEVNEAFVAYHEARARGGVGLTVLEAMAVHPSSPATLNAFDPRLAATYPAMIERLKPQGMRIFQQLFHAGHHSNPLDGSAPWGASDIPGHAIGAPSVRMSKGMIDEIVGSYAAAARLSVELGAEGVEVHCAHGFLIQQFLSTYANDRDDDYGGTPENRRRFMLEVVRAVRQAVPEGTVVGIRIAPDLMTGGVGIDDNLAAAQACEAERLIDYASISSATFQTMPKMIGGMHEPAGFELLTSEPIARLLGVPTIVIGRFRTLEEADQAIRSGAGDMVGMVRATIADPDLVAKTIAGRELEVRPCIACNQGCIGQVLGPPQRMGCAVNPSVGFEATMGDDRIGRTDAPRKVLVIGGGPAGMEAARVAALRGHRVTLAEATPNLGGALALAARAPTRGGFLDLLTWLEAEIYRLGVDVLLSTYLTEDEIEPEQADVVILATGSAPRMDGLQLSNPGEPIAGVDAPHVVSSNDLLAGLRADVGCHAMVVDDTGHFEALAAAETLIRQGAKVTFVTRHNALAPHVESALMVEPALQRMGNAIDVRLRTRALSIRSGSATIAATWLPAETNLSEVVPADTVVLVSANRSNREMFDPLLERGFEVVAIGDAQSPRYLPTAMREANIAARSLA